MKTALREPLLHFFLIGLAVFGLFAVFDDSPVSVDNRTIVVSDDDANRLKAEFETVWRRPPDADEFDKLIAQFIREEVYVREAIALGLDSGDAIIRRRLQLKMEFLTEAGADAVDPDDTVLAAHMAEKSDRFARAPLVAFEQVLLDDDISRARIAEVKATLDTGADPLTVSRASLLPPALRSSPPQVIDGTFGTGFFDALAPLPVGEWSGPVLSSFGRHLVRVTERRDESLPTLAEIRTRVLQDWRDSFAAELREKRYEAMRAQYRIVLPDTQAVADR